MLEEDDVKPVDYEWKVWIYCSLLAAAVPIIIPAVQFGYIYNLWSHYNKPVNRQQCSCSCWDTVFKANYETGVSGYKHVYFNCTSNTLIIWALTVMAVIGLYEAIRHIFTALYFNCARPRMVVLFLSSIFSHVYCWWAYFNYYNDDYFAQWWHQLFFGLTEVASTLMVVHLVNKNNIGHLPRKFLFIISIATLHVLVSGWDQFVANVLRFEGQIHQVLRDLGFMVPDILHIWLSWMELKDMAKKWGCPPSHLLRDKEVTTAFAGVACLWLVATFALPSTDHTIAGF